MDRIEQGMYMAGWDMCLRGSTEESAKSANKHYHRGFVDCRDGKALPAWYQSWIDHVKRCAAYHDRKNKEAN